jgi:hypothetical protein
MLTQRIDSALEPLKVTSEAACQPRLWRIRRIQTRAGAHPADKQSCGVPIERLGLQRNSTLTCPGKQCVADKPSAGVTTTKVSAMDSTHTTPVARERNPTTPRAPATSAERLNCAR